MVVEASEWAACLDSVPDVSSQSGMAVGSSARFLAAPVMAPTTAPATTVSSVLPVFATRVFARLLLDFELFDPFFDVFEVEVPRDDVLLDFAATSLPLLLAFADAPDDSPSP